MILMRYYVLMVLFGFDVIIIMILELIFRWRSEVPLSDCIVMYCLHMQVPMLSGMLHLEKGVVPCCFMM